MIELLVEAIRNNLGKTEIEFKKGLAKDLNISVEDIEEFYKNVTIFSINYKRNKYDCTIDSNGVITMKE